MHEVQEGDVLRWDRVWSVDVSDDPAYLLVTHVDDKPHGSGFILCGAEKVHKYGPGEDHHNIGPWSWAGECFDRSCTICWCEYVPPEEWPDEVCRLVALHHMGIDGREVR